jgi:uncharacterized membrane protein
MGSSLILIVQFLCLSLWIGGSAAVALIVTPEIFRQLDDKHQAGVLTGDIIGKFRTSVLVAIVVLGITIWIQIIALGSAAALKLRLVLMLVSLALLIETYVRFVVSNRMGRIQAGAAEVRIEGKENEFARLHRRSKQSFVLNFLLGIAVVIALVIPS